MSLNHNLRIDPDRLWNSLMEMAQIGGTPKGGCNRQALTPEDAQGRALFMTWCEQAGMRVSVDALGSMFARLEGTDDLPPVLVGSHLDTQPTGGKFDGVLGVLAGLELVRALADAGLRTRRPIEIVNWTNEEGCRFTPVMLGSGVFAGVYTIESALDARDASGVRLGDELARMGHSCAPSTGGRDIGAYVELHIEQGPILEDEGCDIGFVTGGQGHRWYDGIVRGFEAHAGTTPMGSRRDALLAAARFTTALNEIALRHGPEGVATIGHLEVSPNSRNVIAGEVKLSVDIRHPRLDALAAMDEEARAAFAACVASCRAEGALTCVSTCDPVAFDEAVLDIVRAETAALGLRGRDIVSGAGHDAFHMAKITPTAMIFTPCVDGVSHNETEAISKEWAQAGADVLMRTVLALAQRP